MVKAKKSEAAKVPMTKRALFLRIKRRLARDAVFFHETRGGRDSRWYNDLGLYYSVDSSNHICSPGGDDLERIGRELGVLQPWETVVD